ncbi:MAG TPA: sugar-binding protein [Bacillota bacterium]
MKQNNEFSAKICPKTGKVIKISRSDQARRSWWFPIAGLIGFIWFAIRVIPKPSRATYPCQRAAFPLAASFILWLTGLCGGALAFRRLKQYFLKSSRLVGALSMLALTAITCFTLHFLPGKADAAPVRLATSTVAIVQSSQANASNIQYDEIRSMVRKAVDLAGGLSGIVKNGDVVVIKPNLVSYNSNGRILAAEVNGNTTDWRVTKAVVELVRELNPSGKIYIMEGSSVPTQEAFNILKYTSANIPEADLIVPIETDSGAWQDTNSTGLVKVSLPDGLLHKEYYLNRKIKEADVLISLSCLKTHWSAGFTGSCKNIGIGATPGNIYGISSGNPHRNNMVTHDNTAGDLHKWIRDYYKCRPADFTIIDGLQGLQNGPISANSSDQMNMRLILAGKDAVAVDTICGLVMNWDPESIDYLKYLNSDSLGNLDTACINVVGKKVDEVRKSFAGRTPVAGGSKITDTAPPSLTVNSVSLQGSMLNISLATSADTVKVEIYLDGVLQLPVSVSNFSNITINTNGLAPGSHTVSVNAYDRFLNRAEKTVTVNSQGSTTPGNSPSPTPLVPGNYNAPRAVQAPVIDGLGNDSCWAEASWSSISFVWLGSSPSPSDFSGRYKIVWTPERLYYLVEITDDVFSAPYTNPLINYYNNDCVELFIDEDCSGGEHTNNHNAFAYHIQRNGAVTDNSTSGNPKTFNDHVEVQVTQNGNVYTWEIAVKVFPDTYNENNSNNQPVNLTAGKVLGFGVAYNDNDGGSTRENFIGSMEISGTDKNVAYKNASVFGKLQLIDNSTVPSPSATSSVTASPPEPTALTPSPTSSVPPTNGCTVTYTIQNDWGSGATVNVTLKNNQTTAITGWTLVWNFGGNQKITNLWNGTFNQSGTEVTVKNAAYNGTIAPNGMVTFGFNLTYSGTNSKPASFRLNGAVCQVL